MTELDALQALLDTRARITALADAIHPDRFPELERGLMLELYQAADDIAACLTALTAIELELHNCREDRRS